MNVPGTVIDIQRMVFALIQSPSTLLLLLVLLLHVTPVAAGADKSAGGFAAHVGAGSLYGGDGGAAVEYQVVLRPKMRLSPFVAVGTVGMNQSEAPSNVTTRPASKEKGDP